jgi:hypothetical protein
MRKITEQEIKNIVENTTVLNEKFESCAIKDYTELSFSILGKTPFRNDMCISRNGGLIISPQLLLTPRSMDYNLEDLAKENEEIIKARILLMNNFKLQITEHPVNRYKKNIEDVALDLAEKYDKSDFKVWSIIQTPNTQLWRLSLFYYLSKKIFKNNADFDSGLNNRIKKFL